MEGQREKTKEEGRYEEGGTMETGVQRAADHRAE